MVCFSDDVSVSGVAGEREVYTWSSKQAKHGRNVLWVWCKGMRMRKFSIHYTSRSRWCSCHESDRIHRQTVATSEITGYHTDDIEVTQSLPLEQKKVFLIGALSTSGQVKASKHYN